VSLEVQTAAVPDAYDVWMRCIVDGRATRTVQ